MVKKLFVMVGVLMLLLAGIGGMVQLERAKYEKEKAQSPSFQYQNLSDEEGVIVLCYHRVLEDSAFITFSKQLSANTQLHQYNVSLATFKRQMAELKKRNVTVLSVAELKQKMRQKKLQGRAVVLTFDDVDQTLPDNAFPVLQHYQFPFTCFIITGETKQTVDGSRMADWSSIRKMSRRAQTTVGFHTNDLHYQVGTKPVLQTKSGQKVMKKDYQKGQKKLVQQLGKKAKDFAYPYGAVNETYTRYLKHEGIEAIFTLETGVVTNQTTMSQIPRVIVTENNWESIMNWATKKGKNKD